MTSALKAHFEHDAHKPFGVFYPTDYVITVFPSYTAAQNAAEALATAGYEDHVLTMTGDDFIELSGDMHRHASLWAQLASLISRAIGSEELLLDLDLKHARSGCAVLAVHAGGHDSCRQIRRLLEPHLPVSMHYYSKLAVDRMV
jgi:hypothetical protein